MVCTMGAGGVFAAVRTTRWAFRALRSSSTCCAYDALAARFETRFASSLRLSFNPTVLPPRRTHVKPSTAAMSQGPRKSQAGRPVGHSTTLDGATLDGATFD